MNAMAALLRFPVTVRDSSNADNTICRNACNAASSPLPVLSFMMTIFVSCDTLCDRHAQDLVARLALLEYQSHVTLIGESLIDIVT